MVESFVEKPDLETAQGYVADGGYLWNAGMFVARADVLLDEIGRFDQELRAAARRARRGLGRPGDTRSRRRSAVAQAAQDRDRLRGGRAGRRAGRLAVVPGRFGWDDVGDFASVAKLKSGGHASDLSILGENARVLADASSGIVVSHSDRIISLIGVRDIVVVDTPDALLVTTIENAQRVKGVVDALKLSGRDDVL